MATLVLALILAFLSPFGGSIFAFLGCNGEKRSLLSRVEASPLALLDGPLPMPIVFFCLDAAWLNEGRCPGGRPSVSENKVIVANSMEICSLKATTLTTNKKRKTHQPRCSLPESAGTGRCSLFLGRLDQGLVGNAESTHVNRPKG